MTSNNGIAIFEDFPANWELTTLGEVCKRGGGYVQTGPFGSQLHASDYVQEGIPTIMPVNISDNQILIDGIARISEKDAERLSRHRLEPGDIVFSRRGDVTRRALIREEQKGWLCGTGSLKIHFGKDVVDPLFASLYFGHPDVKDWIVRHAVGSTMPNLNGKIMEAIPFLLPPQKEQEKIARILGALDDKIELNRRMNHMLEEMARALFKSWFVDFDPVTAKAEGRVPFGMNAETASLFPAEFEKTSNEDFPEIPIGWQLGTFGNIAENIRRGTNPKDIDPEMPYIGLEHMPRKSIELSDWGRAADVTSNKFAFKTGEILFGKLRPYFHKVGVAPLDGVCSTDVLVISPKSPEYFGLMLGHASSVDFVNFVDAASEAQKCRAQIGKQWHDLLLPFQIRNCPKHLHKKLCR